MYERQVRQAQRQAEISDVLHAFETITTQHHEHFAEAQRPAAPAAQAVDEDSIRRSHAKRAKKATSAFRRRERRAALEQARLNADAEIAAELHRRASVVEEQQQQLDAWWKRLLDNDPETVLEVLEQAFEDNQAEAAPLDVEADNATIAVVFGSPSQLPDRKVALTASGKPTLKKWTKTEAAEFYARCLGSAVLATVREALAVAPGIAIVTVLVIHREPSVVVGEPDEVMAVYCGTFDRSRFDRLMWDRVDPVEELAAAKDVLWNRKGRTKEVAPLDVSAEPEITNVLEETARALGCRAVAVPA